MERSTKHSPRIDDEMAAEASSLTHGAPVEAHAEEWAMAEPPAEGEPGPASVIEFPADAVRDALDENERRRRSELAISLPPHAFPGDRGTLMKAAEQEHAQAWVLELLAELPIDTRFDTVQDVWSTLGGHREKRSAEVAEDAAEDGLRPSDPSPSAPSPSVPSPSATPPSLPSPPPGVDLGQRVASLAGFGIGLATAVVGGTLGVFRRALSSLRR
jgi:hypothetical protein